MKVCWITNIPSPYKVELFELLSKKIDLTVVYEKRTESDRDQSWYNFNDANYTAIYLNERNFISTYQKLSNDCDVLINSDYTNPKAIILNQLFRFKKKITLLHADGGLAIKRNSLVESLIAQLMSKHDYYLSSGLEVNKYFEYYHVPKQKIRLYRFSSYTKADLDKNKELRKQSLLLKKKLGLPSCPIILSVGQQIPRKGYDVLLNACQNLPYEIAIYIVGGTPQKEIIELQNQLKLNNITFIEFLDKETLMEYYAASDIFILPTRYDIWGLVVNEAMSFGLPIISSDKCVAALEFNHYGNCCEIFTSENSNELHKKIVDLLSNSEKAQTLSNESLRVIQEYTIQNTATDLSSIILSLNF